MTQQSTINNTRDDVAQKQKVLVIDDEASILMTIKAGLENTDRFIVQTVSNPLEAEIEAINFDPDIILLDVMMPGMDGGEVASRLWSNKSLRNTPIIFQTAVVTPEEAVAHNSSGKEIYLSKPAPLRLIIEMIDKYCPLTPIEEITSLVSSS